MFRSSIAIVCCSFAAATLLTASVATAAPPNPVIDSLGTTGQAPYTVHVHAMNSTLGAGNINTARFEWDFGDPNGAFNTLVGFNAAHTYNQAGTYTVTLRITNQNGEQAVKTQQVTITADTRSTIYVAPEGNDNNPGTIDAPIKTFAKASQMLANNRKILFKRGGTYNTSSSMNINQQNVVITAYGTGNRPIINWTVQNNYPNAINIGSSAKNVLIEGLRFTSPFPTDNMIVRGIAPHGTNITVRHCSFGKVSYAMNSGGGGGVNGWFTYNNATEVIGAYYAWCEGSNHVHVGNTVAGSSHEHNIRLGGVTRSLIAHNDLTNNAKSTIWCMLGEQLYVANNILREGRFIAGPNFAVGSPSERTRWLVFENNRIVNEGVIIYAGAEDMVLRNNVIKYDGGECFSIWGYYEPMNRTCKNISVLNNTGINYATSYGRFVKLSNGAQNVKIANNLYCATSLNIQSGAANCYVTSNNLNSHSVRSNIWANPPSSNTVHHLNGGMTATQWANLAQTENEMYRNYSSSDLNGDYRPQFNAAVGEAIVGVHTDFYGNWRPSSGPWTVGAIELNPVEPGDPGDPGDPGEPPSTDINADGSIDLDDVLAVVTDWGTCPATCPADVNGDHVVDVNDLLAVILDID